MTTTTHLHYGGEAIELGESCDVEAIVKTILDRSTHEKTPSFMSVSDKHHDEHRILIGPGVSVRISKTNVIAPPSPQLVPSQGPNVADMGF